MHYSWSIINYCQLLSAFSTCQFADATRAPGEMNLKRQMLQDLGLRGWIALYQGPWGRWLADVFLLDSKIVMSHESQFLWVGLPNRSPSTWTQIIKDKFRWFLSNFGDSARFLLALGSVEEGPSNDKQRNVLNDQEGFQSSNLFKWVEGTWFRSSWTDYWQVLARPRIDLHPSQVVCNSQFMLWGCWLFFIFVLTLRKCIYYFIHTHKVI